MNDLNKKDRETRSNHEQAKLEKLTKKYMNGHDTYTQYYKGRKEILVTKRVLKQ